MTMTGYEANLYSTMIASMPRIAKALERIADQLEKSNNKREDNDNDIEGVD